MDVDTALRKAERWLDEIEGVEGVARGKLDGDDCITVFVTSRATVGEIPDTLHGYPVVVEETGSFHAGD